jgi:hypothetical protein
MQRFTTNRAIQGSIYLKKKETIKEEPTLSKETLKKIQLIKKVFR